MLSNYHRIILMMSEPAAGQRYKSDSAGHITGRGKYDYSGHGFPKHP